MGLDTNLQLEGKHKQEEEKVADSGGTTLLVGPSLKLDANNHTSWFANVLYPAYQDLGGVHQELDFTWTMGGKIAW